MRRSLAWAAAMLLSPLAPLPPIGAQGSPPQGGEGPEELGPAEARGRAIYASGTAPSGAPITALWGEDALELPGEAARCSGCHGHDGIGRPEGGVSPSDVTWAHLTRSYGHVHPNGAEHPPFDEESLGRYLRTGVFPGGAAGDPDMPRYDIPDRDLADLVAYLKRVGTHPDPGVGERVLRVGTVVPLEAEPGAVGRAIVEVLEAAFGDLNREGGVYGRTLELVVGDAGSLADPEALRDWIAAETPFALVSPFLPAADAALEGVLAEEGLSVIGPLRLESIRGFAAGRNVYHLLPGLGEQVEALLRHAGGGLGLAGPAALLRPRTGGASPDLVEGVLETGARLGWSPLREVPVPAGPGEVRALQAAGIEVVVSLAGEGDLRAFLEAAAEAGWTPWVLAPGVLSGSLLFDAPEPVREHLLMAYPARPGDRDPAKLRELSRLLEGRTGARHPSQVAVSAYCASAVLLEALRRAGRDVDRRELAAQLDGLYRFETGLLPPITFTPNRRVGIRGAYVVDAGSFAPDGGAGSGAWIDLDRPVPARFRGPG